MDALRITITAFMAGRTEKQVGEESGVGQTWLNRFMKPDRKDGIRNASIPKLQQLADYFKVPLAHLVAAAEASQPARLDAPTLASALEDLGKVLAMSRKKLPLYADQAAALKVFYDEKVAPSGDPDGALAAVLDLIGERGVKA